MKNILNEVVKKIKDLREFSDYSPKELAEIVGLTENEYLEYENGVKDIPIGTFYNLCAALQIDPTAVLTGVSGKPTDYAVVYKGTATSIERYEGYNFISLANDFFGREMEPMIVYLKDGVKPELLQHSGQEFNYVLSGKLRVMVGDKELYLRKGDSLYFNSNLPHAQIAMEGEAVFLTVITEKNCLKH
ncbi:MAG: XRE family transcriptional regulator [Clostridia bacterium]